MITPSWTSDDSAPREADLDAAALFRRILVPIDFGPGSRRALATAIELRQKFDAEICLFHLTEGSGNDEFLAGLGDVGHTNDFVSAAEARMHRFVENSFPGQGGGVITCRAQLGENVANAIEHAAKQWKASLVLLSCHPQRTLFRTQVEKIVQELETPVMLLRGAPEPEH